MAIDGSLTWGQATATVAVGDTVTVPIASDVAPTNNLSFSPAAEISSSTTTQVVLRGLSVGTKTIAKNTAWSEVSGGASWDMGTLNAFTLTVTAPVDDDSFLNKRGLTHFWENIDDIKQDKLTAGTGISITGNTISATGGGVADSVAWGHITGTMADQTDLTTALAAKANSADLATVATSGDYDDLTDKPTIGNATLTIQKNGASAGTFTANATSNQTINITVPTTAADVSALPASTKYGASIAVSINTTDYKVTTTLKDQDGNTLGTAQVIDLPLESVVVNGSYDSTNKKIVLTLQNGNTIDIPVADLVAGLQSEITSTNKLASDLVDDTNQTHKFMTSAEKTKLSGIAAGAEVNVQANWTQTTTTADDYIKNKPTLAAVATSGSYNDLSNKPTIPTVNNATLTIQKNGTTVNTFTANASSNVTANITVPINVSDLTNDAGYLTSVAWGDVTGKPTFATVATSGSYNDLSNKPTIPAAQVNSDWDAASGVAQILNKPTNVSAFANDAGYITSYTDNKVAQTNTNPTSETTYYPVASVSISTNTADVKKFSGFNLKYYNNEGGDAELVLGQNSYYSPIEGKLTLWNSAASQKTTTILSADGATINQLLYSPYTVDASGGRLIANSAYYTATGSATHPVYADAHGILQQTTYTLEKSVPSDAVFTDTTYSDATTSASGLMSASDKTKLNGIASGAEVNVQSDWNQTTTTADDYIKNKPTLATVATSGSYNDLSNKPTIPAAQVQSNWTQTTTTAVDYIKNKPTLATVATSGSYNDLSNKPTIPTVGNATLTIQKNGTNVQTFTANATSNKTANITVPTKTSELTNDSSFVTSSGTVAKADQLTTGRTIALSGGATGTATSFNGTSNISIPVTNLKDAYVTWGGKNLSGDLTPDDMGCIDEFGHNKLAYLPAECIQVHYSTDGGATWTDYGLTDAQKIAMVTTSGIQLGVGKNTTITSSNIANMRLRVRIASGTMAKVSKIYSQIKKMLINVSTNGAGACKVAIRRRTIANYLAGTETWTNAETYNVSGWSGWNSIPYTEWSFGGSMTTQTSQWGQIEFVFWSETYSSSPARLSVIDFRFIGATNWTTPSEIARAGHLYTMDTAQNATFPANVGVTGSLQHGSYTYTLPNKNGTVAMTSDIPSVPTVNNGQLTIQKNGTNVATFTANQSGNATANITVPTKTSDITNDSGYLTSSGAVTSFNGSTGAVTYTAPVTSVNGNTGAVTISVPTKTSDLNNDSGFVTSPIQTSDINSSAVTADKIDWSTMVVVAPKVTSGTTMTLTIPAGTWKLSGCIFFVMSQNSSTYQNVGLVIGTDDRRQNTNFMAYSNAVRGSFTVIDTVTVTANTTVTLHGAGTLRYNSCSLIAERIG